MSNFEAFFNQYLETLLWSTCDDDGEPLDNDYDVNDFDYVCLQKLKSEALDFFYHSRHLWYKTPDHYDIEQHGHDFALTRNHHGAGYWDRCLESVGKELTDMAYSYGNIHVYVGDDNQLYAFGYEG